MLAIEAEAASLRSRRQQHTSIYTGIGSFIVNSHEPRPHRGKLQYMKYIGRGPRVYGLAPRKEGRNLVVENFVIKHPEFDTPDRLFWYKKNLTTRGRWDRLKKFDLPEPTAYKRRLNVSKISAELGFKDMCLCVPRREDVLNFPCPNESANPGPSYCDLGFPNKKAAWPTARAASFRILKDIDNKKNPQLLVGIGSRPKDMDYRDDLVEGEKPARMVLMPDAHEGIIGGIFCKPIMECLKLVQGPLAIGAGFQHGHAQEMVKRMEGYAEYRCLDFSGYDERVYRWAVDTAFNVVKTAFAPKTIDERRRLHNILDWCRDKFLSPYIVTPEGYVYRKHQGTTTGSVWTSLINSIVNYIYLNEALTRAGRGRGDRFKCWVLGDDSVIACKDQMTSMFWNKFDNILEKKMHLKISTSQNILTTSLYASHDDDEDCVQFLGKRWNVFKEPFRSYKDSVRDCMVPEDFIEDPIAACAAVSGIYMDNPFNQRFSKFYEAFIEWVLNLTIVLSGVTCLVGAVISREVLGAKEIDAYNLYYKRPWEGDRAEIKFFKPSRNVINVRWGECNVKIKTSKLSPGMLQGLLGSRNVPHQASIIKKMQDVGAVTGISMDVAPVTRRLAERVSSRSLFDRFLDRMRTIRSSVHTILPQRG